MKSDIASKDLLSALAFFAESLRPIHSWTTITAGKALSTFSGVKSTPSRTVLLSLYSMTVSVAAKVESEKTRAVRKETSFKRTSLSQRGSHRLYIFIKDLMFSMPSVVVLPRKAGVGAALFKMASFTSRQVLLGCKDQ